MINKKEKGEKLNNVIVDLNSVNVIYIKIKI